jgi:hypothetical protein
MSKLKNELAASSALVRLLFKDILYSCKLFKLTISCTGKTKRNRIDRTETKTGQRGTPSQERASGTSSPSPPNQIPVFFYLFFFW